MRSKLLNPDPPVAYAIVLDTGDEVMGELDKFVREHKIAAASVTAIGAFRHALLGYFEWQTKQYERISVDEQVEVLSVLGDVAVAEEKPSLYISMRFSAEPTAAWLVAICLKPMFGRHWKSF